MVHMKCMRVSTSSCNRIWRWRPRQTTWHNSCLPPAPIPVSAPVPGLAHLLASSPIPAPVPTPVLVPIAALVPVAVRSFAPSTVPAPVLVLALAPLPASSPAPVPAPIPVPTPALSLSLSLSLLHLATDSFTDCPPEAAFTVPSSTCRWLCHCLPLPLSHPPSLSITLPSLGDALSLVSVTRVLTVWRHCLLLVVAAIVAVRVVVVPCCCCCCCCWWHTWHFDKMRHRQLVEIEMKVEVEVEIEYD